MSMVNGDYDVINPHHDFISFTQSYEPGQVCLLKNLYVVYLQRLHILAVCSTHHEDILEVWPSFTALQGPQLLSVRAFQKLIFWIWHVLFSVLQTCSLFRLLLLRFLLERLH